MADIHPLLKRQLERMAIEPEGDVAQGAAWAGLLCRISRAYAEHEQERYLLERSQELVSREMGELNAALRAERDLLDQRVRERTEALQVSEGRLASLLSLSADWIWEQDEHLRVTYMSEGIEQSTGMAPAMFIGRQRRAGVGLEATAEALLALETRLAAHAPFRDFAYRITRPDGCTATSSAAASPCGAPTATSRAIGASGAT